MAGNTETAEASDRLFVELVFLELKKARAKHPRCLNSLHEGYAVTLEELDETWAEIKKPAVDHVGVLHELIQTAAMCARTVVDTGILSTFHIYLPEHLTKPEPSNAR